MDQLENGIQKTKGLFPEESPSTVLDDAIINIDRRRAVILLLSEEFKKALTIVSDLNKVNSIIQKSKRPDLILTEPAAQMPIKKIEDLAKTNNFIPSMKALASPILNDDLEMVGKRFPTEEELEMYILAGGRNYEEFIDFTAKNNISDEISDQWVQSHMTHPAFTRMLITIPDLTKHLMQKAFEIGPFHDSNKEEMCVAYVLMSMLVDKKDPYVSNANGQTDNWILCR